jgi:hypothetical protein
MYSDDYLNHETDENIILIVDLCLCLFGIITNIELQNLRNVIKVLKIKEKFPTRKKQHEPPSKRKEKRKVLKTSRNMVETEFDVSSVPSAVFGLRYLGDC